MGQGFHLRMMAQESCWQTLLNPLWHFWTVVAQWAGEEGEEGEVEEARSEEVERELASLKSGEFL